MRVQERQLQPRVPCASHRTSHVYREGFLRRSRIHIHTRRNQLAAGQTQRGHSTIQLFSKVAGLVLSRTSSAIAHSPNLPSATLDCWNSHNILMRVKSTIEAENSVYFMMRHDG